MNIEGCGTATNRDEKNDYRGEETVNRLMYSRILGQIKAHTQKPYLFER